MTTQVLTALLLLVLPVAYNLLYTLLARSFDYPDILRQPTSQILERFAAGGGRLVLIWWGFAMSAVLLAPAVVLVSATLADADPSVLALATAIGLLAALVQFLGLIRWPFAVPHLARLAGDPATTPATRDAIEVVFQTLNRYPGVAVGEHLGYLLTGLWTALAGVAVIQSDLLHPLVGIVGLVLAPLLSSGRWSSSAPSRSAAGGWPAPWSRSPTSAGRCGCWPWVSACCSPPDLVRLGSVHPPLGGCVRPSSSTTRRISISPVAPYSPGRSGTAPRTGTLGPFHGLLHRRRLEDPVARDQLLRLGERPIDDGAVPPGEL